MSESNNKIKEQKNNIQKPKKCILGRKRKNSNEKGFHNNYCKDNIIQRSNCPILSEKNELNNEKDFNKNIGEGKIKKKTLKNKRTKIIKGKTNKKFLNKTLKVSK